MKTATYDASGGPLVVSVTCSPRRDGSYSILLWKAGENKVVKRWDGNFVNTDDDSYQLSKPNSAHNGRHLECIATVSVPPGVGPATITLTVSQDGADLAADSGSVPPDSPGGMVDLFIALNKA